MLDESSVLNALVRGKAQVFDWPLGGPQSWAINPTLTRRCLPASGDYRFPVLVNGVAVQEHRLCSLLSAVDSSAAAQLVRGFHRDQA
jgi:hypothetical protein